MGRTRIQERLRTGTERILEPKRERKGKVTGK
jgi:hypothetical protein